MDNLTSKQRHERVAERSTGICELCFSNNLVQHHHIIKGKGKRKQCETVYSIIALCWECHHGDEGIHGKSGYKLDLQLKQRLQKAYFKQGLSEEEVRKLMGGKLY